MRGYQLGDGDYLMVEDDALKQLMPESDKTLSVKGFIECSEIDKLYFDRPYYLAPATSSDEDGFQHLAQTLEKEQAAALAEAVLFRRNRMVLIRPHDKTLVATTLNFDYEVRSSQTAFKNLPEPKFDADLLELAAHIIQTRMGDFHPSDYEDRYNGALRELVEAKIAGKAIKPRKPEAADNIVDLREALRQSAKNAPKGKRRSTAAPRSSSSSSKAS